MLSLVREILLADRCGSSNQIYFSYFLIYLQHKLIGFYNRDEKCLQRGTDWVFKYSSLRFVFKRLILVGLVWFGSLVGSFNGRIC